LGRGSYGEGDGAVVKDHFLRQEIRADGRFVGCGELLVHLVAQISEKNYLREVGRQAGHDILVHERGLADAAIAEDDDLELWIRDAKSYFGRGESTFRIFLRVAIATAPCGDVREAKAVGAELWGERCFGDVAGAW
jgi:hypothetical protein